MGRLHGSAGRQCLIKRPYLIPRDLAGTGRYVISISFATCVLVRVVFYNLLLNAPTGHALIPGPLLFPEKYEAKSAGTYE